MRKNSAGIIVSVTDISEVHNAMVHCSVCGNDFVPSLDCDVFPLRDARDASGEMPLQCEVCMDRAFAAQGVGSIDMSRADGIRFTPAQRSTSQSDSFISRVRGLFGKK